MSLRIILVVLLTVCMGGILPAANSTIGVAMANGSFWLDHSQVVGNATVFDGSVIETGKAMSDLSLTGGLKMRLGVDSRGQVFSGRLELEQGAGQVSGSKYVVKARGLRVFPVTAGAIVRVEVGPGNTVEVAAVTGSFRVETVAGLRVANMAAGAALSFTEQAGAAPPTVVCGNAERVDGKLTVTDKTSGVTVELAGESLEQYIGKSISVTGNRTGNDALHVLSVKKDACKGAGAAAVAGAGAAAGAGATAGSGAAAGAASAGAASAGAAGAGAAGAGAGAAAAGAGISTAAIAGIAVATVAGVGVGVAATKGVFSTGNASK
jgi:hypothetical protein